jgi:acyl-CoA thioesterase-2
MPEQERDVPYFVDAFEYRQAAGTMPDGVGRTEHAPVRDVWVRTTSSLPDSPLLHACVLAYASDKPLLGTTVLAPPVCADPRPFLVASLDHSMWFHRPCRADAWTLFHLHSSATGQGRAFARAECFRDDGALAFSAAQQGLVRPLR